MTKRERALIDQSLTLVETTLMLLQEDEYAFLEVIEDGLQKLRTGLFQALKSSGATPPFVTFPGGKC